MALQHLRSSTANKRPLATALVSGQLAVNTEATSPGLFFKNASGSLVKVGPCHVGATAPNASPASGGETGNTLGEQWLDTSGTNPILKIWNGSTWVSDAAEFVNASGDTMTGALVMDNQQQVRFRETTANGTNYIAIQAPASVASDKTLTLPDVTGTLVSTGDTGSVTSTMIANGTIVNDDVNASAAIAGTKISPDFGAQNVTTTGTSTAASFIPSSSTAPANGMYLSAANTLAFNTNSAASPRAVIDSSGRLGINTTDPSAAGATAYRDLVIAGSGNRGITIQCGSANVGGFVFNTSNGGNNGGYIYDASASQMLISAGGGSGNIAFSAGGSQRAAIDSSGRLLVGTSTARSNFYNTSTIAPALQVEGTSFSGSSLSLVANGDASASTPYSVLAFGRSRGTAVGSNTVVASGDYLGEITFQGSDGTEFVNAAIITAIVDGTPGANDMPGRIVFSTTSDGASSPTERLRITSTGQVRLAGAGITFNGDTAAANELDDYEEGTFTPTIVGTSTAGTGTYTAQIGRYTKIGNRVFFQCYVVWTAHTGTGNMNFDGLPFATSAATNTWSAVATWSSNVALTAGNLLQAYTTVNSTQITMRQYPTGGGASVAIALDTAGDLMFSGHYLV